MSHDVLAELEGYRNELAEAERHGRDEKAAAVRDEIERVKAAVEARAVALEDRAATLEGSGQDVKAAEATVEARRYRDALTEPDAERETAMAEAAPETATPRKRTGGRANA